MSFETFKQDYQADVDMQSTMMKFSSKKIPSIVLLFVLAVGNDDDLLEWYPSQVKGPVDDEVQEGKHFYPTENESIR